MGSMVALFAIYLVSEALFSLGFSIWPARNMALKKRSYALRVGQSVLLLLVGHYQGICRASGTPSEGMAGEVQSLVGLESA